MEVDSFNYKNTEIKEMNGEKTIRKVSIKNGIGYKSVTKYRRGKKVGSVKMPVHLEHIKVIRGGKFIKGLFDDCKNCKKNKTRKNRK